MRAPELIAICGDWHTNRLYALALIPRLAEIGVTQILHLGDFGYWPDTLDGEMYLDEINTILDSYGISLWFIDGNHENHPELLKLPVDDFTGLQKVRSHIHHIPRGHRWEWDGAVWLGLGGAASVNRKDMVAGVDWFMEEYITVEDALQAAAPGHADVMLTHEAPYNSPTLRMRNITNGGWPESDIALAVNSAKMVEAVMEEVTPVVLFHGHHHHRYTDYMEDGTKIVGLDMDETYNDNFVIVDNFGHIL